MSVQAAGVSHDGSHRLVDVAICTFNRSRFLRICLDALLPQFNDEYSRRVGVLVIDNNCTDDTARMVSELQRTYPFIRYLQEPKQGLSNARNCGERNSEAQYICYLDDDGKPGEAYLETLVRILSEENPDFAGGPILPYYLSERPAWFKDEFEIRRHAPGTGFFDCPISGGNFVVRLSLLRELGGFAPHLGMVGNKVRLGEERELIERYRRRCSEAERRIYYAQSLFIYHYVPPVKMTMRYMLGRAYQSGKMSVVVKRESVRSLPWILTKLFRETVSLIKLYRARAPVDLRVNKLRGAALLIGKLVGLVRQACFLPAKMVRSSFKWRSFSNHGS